jgi:hypothetical protein
MAFEKKVDTEKTTVRMQYRGHFKGSVKTVQLPIPLIANSQKIDQTLSFERAATSRGPAFCDVPLEWAGTLLAVGGNWSAAEPLSPELLARIAAAKEVCDEKMRRFILENEMVDA